MMLYALICLSLILASLTGLQFLYMFYLDRLHNSHKTRLRELEKRCKYLTKKLNEAESQITEQNARLGVFYERTDENEEVWADVIDEN